ncbi:NAD(P)-binding protein [Wolfiporia cocos MD-104 SS10]|uniref:NAD(P)-binding protein n=1 Tax=Wolfiporia cocos (strain MD-104) TaxID=742152 RepID=A0A2H3JTD3_WOLCO|nr:NAD(P)-binding protein [Wolfiporia cocos MD-104 SS10]
MSIFSQSFPPKAKWTADDIPDLTGKVMLVTGGHSGIGKETVKALLAHNATVYMAARSRARAEAAIAEPQRTTGRSARFLDLDLASLASVRRAAEDCSKTQLHVLFNSGCVLCFLYDGIQGRDDEGYDLQFGVNVLGHFHLTRLLLPALLAASSSPTSEHHAPEARVVTTSSLGHVFTPLDLDAVHPGPARTRLGRQELYQMSKYGNVVFAAELARRYGEQELVSIAVNPGNIRSDLNRDASAVQKFLSRILFYPTEKGALTQLFAGTAPEAESMNGKYLIPWARVGEARPDALDPELGKKLWEWMEEQVNDA